MQMYRISNWGLQEAHKAFIPGIIYITISFFLFPGSETNRVNKTKNN
jgi:hypothetical protein